MKNSQFITGSDDTLLGVVFDTEESMHKAHRTLIKDPHMNVVRTTLINPKQAALIEENVDPGGAKGVLKLITGPHLIYSLLGLALLIIATMTMLNIGVTQLVTEPLMLVGTLVAYFIGFMLLIRGLITALKRGPDQLVLSAHELIGQGKSILVVRAKSSADRSRIKNWIAQNA